jgi:hypothetical protein
MDSTPLTPRWPSFVRTTKLGSFREKAAGPYRFCFGSFRSRTPGPPPFSSMNSMPADPKVGSTSGAPFAAEGLGSFRKKGRGRFLPLLLGRLSKPHACSATVLVDELERRPPRFVACLVVDRGVHRRPGAFDTTTRSYSAKLPSIKKAGKAPSKCSRHRAESETQNIWNERAKLG